jgi:hypothetical protein
MSGIGLPPLRQSTPKTITPSVTAPTFPLRKSVLDQGLLGAGSYDQAGQLLQGLNPSNIRELQRTPIAGGLLNNRTSNYNPFATASTNMQRPPQQGFLNNFGSNLINNPLFMLGAALSDRSKPFAQNFANFQNNLLQRQLLGRQLQQQDFKNKLDLATLGIQQATAGKGTLSTKAFRNKKGEEIFFTFDSKRGLLDSSGKVISPQTLVKQGFTEVNPSQVAVYTGDTKDAMKSKLQLAREKAKIEGLQKFADKSNDLGLKRISETVYEPARGLMDFAKNVRNINEFISQSKLDQEKGGKIFKFKTNMLATMGLKTDEVSADEVVEALRTKYAPALREAGSGATSDYEMEMYLNAFPSLAMTAQGREMLERATTTIANRESEYSTLVQNFITKQGKIPTMNDLQGFQEQVRNKFKMDIDVQKKLGIYNEEEEQFIQNFDVTKL